MATLLKRAGADKVVDPEEESGLRSARILLSSSFLDFFRMDDNLSIIECKPRPEWVGNTLRQLELRKKHDINVIAIKSQKGWSMVSPDHPLQAEDRILLVAQSPTLKKFH